MELPVIRDEAPPPRKFSRPRAVALHVFRILLFVAVLFLIRTQHRQRLSEQAARTSPALAVDAILNFYPTAARLGEFDPDRGLQPVYDVADETLGFVVQTSPVGDDVVGFSGPTNMLMAFGPDARVIGASILWSRDTREHVRMVERDSRLLSAWNGLTWDKLAAASPHVDTVSGATLTSLAIAESVSLRISGQRPSLRFPEPPMIEEVRELFPDAEALVATSRPYLIDVRSRTNQAPIGFVLRTSPSADDIIGYQGPTDVLVALDTHGHVTGIRVRKSFDNEPYVGYVRDDRYFLRLFNKWELGDADELVSKAERIEGVSGATMTSQGIGFAVARAMNKAAEPVPANPPQSANDFQSGLAWRLVATLLVLVAGLCGTVLTTTLRSGIPRRIYQAISVIVIGLVNGDLISQAQLVGWTQNGLSLQFAQGLTVTTLLALAIPVISREQFYCNHVCPHGILQQWLHRTIYRWLPWHPHLPPRLARLLSVVPALLLVIVVLTGLCGWPVQLADLEAFDAWTLNAAGVASLSIALAGLMLSALIPMAYCRFGCPTGAMLGFLRFHGRSDQWQFRDTLACLLAALAAAITWLT